MALAFGKEIPAFLFFVKERVFDSIFEKSYGVGLIITGEESRITGESNVYY